MTQFRTQFRLNMLTDTTAFHQHGADEVLRLLKQVQEAIEKGYGYGVLTDRRGATLGSWQLNLPEEGR